MKPQCLTFLLGFLCLTSCSTHNQDASAPLRAINPIEGEPLIKAWQKESPITLTLDTGAAQPIILFDYTALAAGGKLRGRGPIYTTNIPIKLSETANPFDKVFAISAPSLPYQGILGWPIIQQTIWNINFPDSKHSFHSKLPNKIKSWEFLPIVQQKNILQLDDKSGRSIALDTGAKRGIYLNSKNWQRWKKANPKAKISLYSGFSPAAGGMFVREYTQISQFKIGSLKFENIELCESFLIPAHCQNSLNYDIIIGREALQNFEIWIDGKENKFYFSQKSNEKHFPESFNEAGMLVIENSDRQINQLKVLKHSLAWKAGFRSGDTFISLNDIEFPSEKVINFYLSSPGSQSEWKLMRGNKRISLNLEIPSNPEQPEVAPTSALR